MKIALLLSTAFVTTLPSAPDRERRLQQYLDGLRQVAELSAAHPVFDIFSVDNTVEDPTRIDAHLTAAVDAIPGLQRKCYFNDNEVGRINKGSGLVAQWARILPDLAGTYQYTIHYEPRQKLVNASFFERMEAHPAAYVCFYRDRVRLYGVVPMTLLRAWTGLFSMKTVDLMAYVEAPDRGVLTHISEYQRWKYYRRLRWRVLPGWYAEMNECVESDFPKYLLRHQIEITNVADLATLWHEEATGKWFEMKDRVFEH